MIPVSERYRFLGHGYRIDGKGLFVGSLPGRKQVCLYVEDGSVLRTLAFFKTDDQAREALEIIDLIAGASRVHDTAAMRDGSVGALGRVDGGGRDVL